LRDILLGWRSGADFSVSFLVLTAPVSRSISMTSPSLTALLMPSAAIRGSPLFIAFRKNILANDSATTATAPAHFIARAACSRLEPQPKFLPPTIMSPCFILE
jgi:hypothetical protein